MCVSPCVWGWGGGSVVGGCCVVFCHLACGLGRAKRSTKSCNKKGRETRDANTQRKRVRREKSGRATQEKRGEAERTTKHREGQENTTARPPHQHLRNPTAALPLLHCNLCDLLTQSTTQQHNNTTTNNNNTTTNNQQQVSSRCRTLPPSTLSTTVPGAR